MPHDRLVTAAAQPQVIGRSGPAPRAPVAWRAALHVLEHHILVYRRTFRGTLFSTFLAPVLFLAAMGLGLGGLVNQGSAAAFGGLTYLAFLAPGLLVAQAMQAAAGESMYPVMAGLVWLRTYHAMVAAPLRIIDIVVGQALWVTLRLTLTAVVFVAVMVAFGATNVIHAIVMVPFAVLTGLGFAAPIAAFSATQRKDNNFAAINRFVITPLFIFSGIFFPLAQLPAIVQPIAWLTPLWHGAEIVRAIQRDAVDPVLFVIHLAAIIAFIVIGVLLGARTFTKALVK